MGGFFSGSRSHFVNDNAPDRLTSIGFHANMFIEYDWAALKTFCNKRDISQTHLNLMFKKFLTYKNVHLNGYKVRLDDIKSFFLKETRITMVSTNFPSLFSFFFINIPFLIRIYTFFYTGTCWITLSSCTITRISST